MSNNKFEEKEKQSRLINREYFISLLTREIKMCILKEDYNVGIYTYVSYGQNKYVLDIINDILKENKDLSKEHINLIKTRVSQDNILIDLGNGSIIRTLSCNKNVRGYRFHNVVINSLINKKDVNEIILPTLKMYYYDIGMSDSDGEEMSDKVFYCEF